MDSTRLRIILEARNRNEVIHPRTDSSVDVDEHISSSAGDSECAEISGAGKQTDGLRISVVPIYNVHCRVKIGVDIGRKTGHACRPGRSRIGTVGCLQPISVAAWKGPGILGWRAKNRADAVVVRPRDRYRIVAIVEIV